MSETTGGPTLPAHVVAAGGGVVLDVDGNSLIDFGSGIAVTTVGRTPDRCRSAHRVSRTDDSNGRDRGDYVETGELLHG